MSFSNNSTQDERLRQFERNKYFYGKLMTVSDFESEQTYHNDKRHLINRLIHGEGIICGLHVRNLKDWSVTLSPGIALDCMGQEIVVSKNEERLVSTDKVNPTQSSSSSNIGIFIKRKDEGKDPLPQTFSNEQACMDSKIQEDFEVYLDLISDETSLVSSDECPSCKGKEPGVLLSVLRKSSQGWEIDHMGTLQQRKIVSSWFNYRGIETSQPTESKNLTTGLIELDFSKGTNMLYGPIKHYVKNITTPPFVALAKAADSTTVEYIEDYGLCNRDNNSASSSSPTLCFKAVNINLDTFMIRIDSEYSGSIILRYWASAARDTGKQHANKLLKPTLQFSSQKYSLEDVATITITDPTMDRTTDVDSVQIKVSVPNTQTKTYHAKETGLRSGVFNVQVPIRDITTSAPNTLTAIYEPKNLSPITGQVEIVQTEKPQISFTSNSYRIGDKAIVKIVDNSKGPADVLLIQVTSSRDSTTRQYYAKHVIKNLEGTIFKVIFNVTDVALSEPDAITAVYKYQLGVGDTIREAKTTAKVGP